MTHVSDSSERAAAFNHGQELLRTFERGRDLTLFKTCVYEESSVAWGVILIGW